jgi:cytochrome c peroxidase
LAASDTTTAAYERFGKDYPRPIHVPEPADNRVTPARELLGRTLFFDPRLSGSNWISCASCHNPGFAWSDGLPRAIGAGMQRLGRRTPTIDGKRLSSSSEMPLRAERDDPRLQDGRRCIEARSE